MTARRRVETIHKGAVFSVQVLTWTDAKGQEIRRDVVRHPGAVVVVPVLDADHLLMIRNYRVAVDERLWEFPAGKLEAEEAGDVAAARELEEETGYQPASVEKLAEFYTSPGFADELMQVFIARDLKPVGQRLEPGEEIEVQKISRREAQAMARDGRLRDGKTIAALLLWLRMEEDRRA